MFAKLGAMLIQKNVCFRGGVDMKSMHPLEFHKKGKHTRRFIVYSVWDNRTDELIILDGEAPACAKAMGISFKSFYSTMNRVKHGEIKKWTIESRYLDGK